MEDETSDTWFAKTGIPQRGYKRRNASLDRLVSNPPRLIKDKGLASFNVDQEEDEEALEELRAHLLERLLLLDRVIRARRLHHAKFFSLELDYGHENFINQLSAQRTPLLRALESTVRRLAEVQFHQQKWFHWIRELENADELQRDVEKKKVKQEAALFQRHQKEIEHRQKVIQLREERKRQEAYLDEAWKAQKQLTDSEDASDEWDPIEDTIENERELYLDLLCRFLWRPQLVPKSVPEASSGELNSSEIPPADPIPESAPEKSAESSVKSKNARKKARQKANAKTNQQSQLVPAAVPGKIHVETMKEMRYRLQNPDRYKGDVVRIGIDMETGERVRRDRPAVFEANEVEHLVSQLPEVKELLFCRLLLSRPSLLRAALKAQSIEEFLSDERVENSELRDLCLKMEQPELQDIRDACADFKRAEDDPDEIDSVEIEVPQATRDMRLHLKRAIPSKMETKAEQKINSRRLASMKGIQDESGGAAIDFGNIEDDSDFTTKRISVTVCGRRIHNYPSEKAMSRGGWLQFSVLAKTCTAFDAVSLCRNWDEFFELIILIQYNYFPAAPWLSFIQGQTFTQLMTLGFVTYFDMDVSGLPTIDLLSRQFRHVESRNWICGVMKRNDPVTRRFIQRVVMQSSTLVILVRDVSTGEVLVQPPDDQLWLIRGANGSRHADDVEWTVFETVGPEFLERMSKSRQWSLNFKDYYDIIIWHFSGKRDFADLEESLQFNLFKALKFQETADIYRPTEYILRHITYDYVNKRARDVKEGEQSMWDQQAGPGAHLKVIDYVSNGPISTTEFPDEWKYGEADRWEDEALFSSEAVDTARKGNSKMEYLLASQNTKMHELEHKGPNLAKFALDLDSDDDIDDDDFAAHMAELDGVSDIARSVTDEGDSEWEDTDDGRGDEAEWDEIDDMEDEDLENLTFEEKAAFYEAEEAYHDWITTCGLVAASDIPSRTDATAEAQMSRFRSNLRAKMKDIGDEAMENEFDLFIDRFRATAFKDSWHSADLEPGARERWSEFQTLLKAWTNWRVTRAPATIRSRCMKQKFQLLSALKVYPYSHSRILRDMGTAVDITDLFFNVSRDEFIGTEVGKKFEPSPIWRQDARVLQLPQRRTPHSNKYRTEREWQSWDRAVRNNRSRSKFDAVPKEWDVIVRPMIAKFYRSGVICPAYQEGTAGITVCLKEQARPEVQDLFFDWRPQVRDQHPMSYMKDPFAIKPLQDQAKVYAQSNPGARFTVLKLWSAPHFWPLMVGYANRPDVSFFDTAERPWHWKFAPKDMPFSEWSIHRAAASRLEEHKQCFSTCKQDCEVVQRKDMFIVMAKNEELCRFYTAATIYAIQTRPWRLDIDPWKSWFNVDATFVASMDAKWWE